MHQLEPVSLLEYIHASSEAFGSPLPDTAALQGWLSGDYPFHSADGLQLH